MSLNNFNAVATGAGAALIWVWHHTRTTSAAPMKSIWIPFHSAKGGLQRTMIMLSVASFSADSCHLCLNKRSSLSPLQRMLIMLSVISSVNSSTGLSRCFSVLMSAHTYSYRVFTSSSSLSCCSSIRCVAYCSLLL